MSRHPIRWFAVWLGARDWLPGAAPGIVAVDRFLRTVSSGHLTLLSLVGLPELFLTVRGRRSGLPRTTPLLCTPHQGGWLVVGSNWGAAKAPVWVANVAAADTAVVEYRARSITVQPRLLEGSERDHAWSAAVATWPNYAVYERRTDRTLTVWLLQPI